MSEPDTAVSHTASGRRSGSDLEPQLQHHQFEQQHQDSSYQPDTPQNSDIRSRPPNNVRPRQLQNSASNASRSVSGAPSTSQTHSSYASVPSQHSLRAPSAVPSQASSQSLVQARAPLPPSSSLNASPQGIRGYQSITSVEPAPKRPLWSLGSTLPRVRRLPAKPTKTAQPTPGSRSNIVQQPPVMVPMQPTIQAAGETVPVISNTIRQAPSDSRGGPCEPVHGHDFAETTGNESYNAHGVTDNHPEAEDLSTSPTTSSSMNAGAGDLPPIREGEPLPADSNTEAAPSQVLPRTADGHARPRLDHSFSSPTAADLSNIQVVGDDKLNTAFQSKNDTNPNKSSSEAQEAETSDPQERLSAARKQLVQEAKHGDGLLATQGSAVDANDYDDADDDTESFKPETNLNGVASHLASKHIKTSSMPFLPSQGFDVLVAEPSHKGADQLNIEARELKRSRADSHNRSAMDQTRHPGLSGARPAPRGRAAGGPAAGVGIRKPSTQSNRRSSSSTHDVWNTAGYFDDQEAGHELSHLDRHGSYRHRRGSQQSNRTNTEDDHFESRPVGGRSGSHRSSNGRDTRSAWLSRSMPSHASHRQKEEGRGSKDGDGPRKSLQQSRDRVPRKIAEGDEEERRHSEETVYSTSSYEQRGAAQASGQDAQIESQRWEEERKSDGGEEDEGEDLWLGGQGTFADGSIAFPTTWSKWRYHSREFFAELVATMLLITVGTAVDCQVTLSQSTGQSAGAYPNQNWAWGIAVASTIYLSGGRSGAHCNPAITLALAVFRGFPWIQVPIYWTAQLLGSILGAAITYGIYLPAIDHYEGGRHIRTLAGDHGTGKLFVTVPQLVFTAGSGFGTEVVATSILMAMVLAVGDETNAPPSDGLSALVLGFVVVMIGMSFGWPTSYAISPSRDLGPRLFLYMVGYGSELWTHNDYWWLYGPQAGCFTGGLLGALLYDLAIFTGEESPINYTKQGWKQSTPARIGSRVLNNVERLEFFTSPLRHLGQTSSDGSGDESPRLAGNRSAAVGHSRSETDMLGSKRMRKGETQESAEPALGTASDGVSGVRRRHSQASRQLDAQEQGLSHTNST